MDGDLVAIEAMAADEMRARGYRPLHVMGPLARVWVMLKATPGSAWKVARHFGLGLIHAARG